MRKVIQEQMKFGEVAISDIEFDIRSRDEIPKLLLGLQEVYCDITVRRQVFEVLVNLVPKGINPHKGRRGMDLWKILVLGVLRLNCNWDYDKLKEICKWRLKSVTIFMAVENRDTPIHFSSGAARRWRPCWFFGPGAFEERKGCTRIWSSGHGFDWS